MSTQALDDDYFSNLASDVLYDHADSGQKQSSSTVDAVDVQATSVGSDAAAAIMSEKPVKSPKSKWSAKKILVIFLICSAAGAFALAIVSKKKEGTIPVEGSSQSGVIGVQQPPVPVVQDVAPVAEASVLDSSASAAVSNPTPPSAEAPNAITSPNVANVVSPSTAPIANNPNTAASPTIAKQTGNQSVVENEESKKVIEALQRDLEEAKRQLRLSEEKRDQLALSKRNHVESPKKIVAKKTIVNEDQQATQRLSEKNLATPLVVKTAQLTQANNIRLVPKTEPSNGRSRVKVIGVTSRAGNNLAVIEFGGEKRRIVVGDQIQGLGQVTNIVPSETPLVEINGVVYR